MTGHVNQELEKDRVQFQEMQFTGRLFFVFRERVSFLLSAFIKITAKMNDITSLIRDAQSIVTIL